MLRAIRSARLAVYAPDKSSPAQDLVTALLQDPLASDNAHNDRIRTRWNARVAHHPLTISHESSAEPSDFKVSSPYLLQFPTWLQITEIPPTAHDGLLVRSLLQADVAVIVCNPLTTSLSHLLETGLLSNNPNIILVLTSTSVPPVIDSPAAFLSRFLPQGHPSRPFDGVTILPMDPPRAVAAIESLTADSRSSTAVQKYQDDFVGSRVSTLTTALKSKFGSGLDHIRIQTALADIKFELAAAIDARHDATRELETICSAVRDLNDRIEEAKIRTQGDVLGRQKDAQGDQVTAALHNATKEIRIVMDRLSWFKMVTHVDEISYIVGQAVERAWCRALEKQLIFHTGRLSALQTVFTKDAFALLESEHTPTYNSAVLSNTLHQLAASPSYTLTPNILTSPIHTRRAQIIKYPTTQLHVAGQRAVLTMGGSIVAGAGVGWAGWLAGTGEGFLGIVGMDAGTAMGVGLLTAVAGVRWAVGRWEKAKRRWWEDWERIGQGLGRDLRATLDRVVRENVVVVAESGCRRLSELAVKHREKIEQFEGQMEAVQTEVRVIEQRNLN